MLYRGTLILTAQVMGAPFSTVQCKEYGRHSTCHCKSCMHQLVFSIYQYSSGVNKLKSHLYNEVLSSYQSSWGNKQLLCYLFSDI